VALLRHTSDLKSASRRCERYNISATCPSKSGVEIAAHLMRPGAACPGTTNGSFNAIYDGSGWTPVRNPLAPRAETCATHAASQRPP
jgi:hypothetical protein